MADWGATLSTIGIAVSMAVNTLVTGLIVFKILRVFLSLKSTVTSVERTLDSTGGTRLRHIMFVLIESGMALFAIQLIHLVFDNTVEPNTSNLIIGINEMFNVIILRSVHIYFFFFLVLLINIYLARASHQQ